MNKLPCNIDAEKSILGLCITAPENLITTESILHPDDFMDVKNQQIYHTLLEMSEEEIDINPVVLSDQLSKKHILDKCGGKEYLTDVMMQASAEDVFESYCKIVREKSLLRQLANLSTVSYKSAVSEKTGAAQLIDETEQRLSELSASQKITGLEHAKPIAEEVLIQLEELRKQEEPTPGLETGFKLLDEITAGLQKTDLIYLAARPSMGKTALALNIASNAVLKGGKTVAIFSLEMSKAQLMNRLLTSTAMIPQDKMKIGDLSDSDMLNLQTAVAAYSKSGLYIDDNNDCSLADIRSKVRKLKAKQGLDLIIIDYLQLMDCKTGYGGNRVQEISVISRGLKAIAKEMDCPVLCLSQLNRGVESRQDHRPILSDLRDSGSIEQDADIVMFLYRDIYYNEEADPLDAELSLAKHRNGRIGVMHLCWKADYAQFSNIQVGSAYDGN